MLQSTLKNRTIFCKDNLDILQNIDSNTIDLIYLDPPFNKNKVFTAPIGSSAEGASFKDIFRKEDVKDEWVQTIKEDNIELYNFLNGVKNISSNKYYLYNYCYLTYMAIRLMEMHRILKDTGSLYFHCDPTMSHYIKLLMDIIFGEKNFRNEIVWDYKKISNAKGKRFNRRYDIIIFYAKSKNYIFNHQYTEISQRKKELIQQGFNTKNMNGNKYIYIYDEKKIKKKGIDLSKYNVVKYVNIDEGTLQSNVFNIDNTNSQSKEYVGYPTQKPLALLERIIKASSNKGDIILDPFCGCATTCVAAEKLDRQWMGIDVSVKAYELVKTRLNKEIRGEDENGQRDLLNYEKEVYYTTIPPKRTDIKGDDNVLRKYVYVISNPKYKNLYKVGIAKDYKARLNSYQTSDPYRNYKLEYKTYTPWFRALEKHIHTTFENMFEWVKADLNEIINEIESYKE